MWNDYWDWKDIFYQFEAWETTYPGTYLRYVGFYKSIYLASAIQHWIWIEFNGRATSGYSGSSVTNLHVVIYTSDWQTKIVDWTMIANPGVGKDSGWRFKFKEFDMVDLHGTSAATYNVFICYSDSWSACWNQRIYVKNIYLRQWRG